MIILFLQQSVSLKQNEPFIYKDLLSLTYSNIRYVFYKNLAELKLNIVRY